MFPAVHRTPRGWLRAGGALALAFALLPAPTRASSFQTGFFDPVFGSNQGLTWLGRSAADGASVVRVMPSWAAIAPSRRPSAFDPRDPADPAYRWAALDQTIRDANAVGLQPLLTIDNAPEWAQGRGRPRSIVGNWRVSAQALGAFVAAAAKRYSGTFPDPQFPGRSLPQIRYWQIWNEPNLSSHLAPQWERSGRRFVPTGVQTYRRMLGDGYREIKQAIPNATVGMAGLAPFGDLAPHGSRMPPLAFFRRLLCVNAKLRRTCKTTVRMDAVSHHPYSVGGPLRHALNPDDVTVPDFDKIRRVIRGAQAARTLSTGEKRLWVTEISWDSKPPDPYGVPEARQARWLEQALYVLWRQKVSLVTWFRILDQERGRGYEFGNQSGTYLQGGKPKASARAFAFPLVVDTSRRSVWGMAPRPHANVQLEWRSGRVWRKVRSVVGAQDRTFHVRLHVRPTGEWRASADGRQSLIWRVS